MKSRTRPHWIAIAAGTVAAVSMAGCAPTSVGEAFNSGSSAASQPAEPTAAAERSALVESPEGDVVLKLDASGKPAVITDKYGSYALTTIDPTDESMVVDQASLDSSVAQSGWSEADVLSAQQFVVTFVAEQLNDSTALDRQTGWEQWKQDEAPKYVHPDYVDGIRSEQSDGADRSIIISNNFNNATPDLVRDGGPRVAAGEISTDQVWAFTTDAGVLALSIKGTSSYTYRAVDGAPVYSDTDWAYALARSEGSWLITGFENGFDLRR